MGAELSVLRGGTLREGRLLWPLKAENKLVCVGYWEERGNEGEGGGIPAKFNIFCWVSANLFLNEEHLQGAKREIWKI